MSGLAYTPNVATDATAEFDLTLECPGRWSPPRSHATG